MSYMTPVVEWLIAILVLLVVLWFIIDDNTEEAD